MTVLTGSTGAARAVDVVLVAASWVVVHDQRNVVDMDAAGGYVGCNQDLGLASGEVGKCPFALVLASVTVDGDGAEASLGKYLGDTVAAFASAAKHNRRFVPLQHSNRMGNAIDWLNEVPRVFHVAEFADRFVDLEGQRVVLVPLDQHVDVAVEGGREQQCVSIARRLVEDALDRRQEAHVGHSVGFVDDRDLDVAQIAASAPDQVFESSRAGDQDVDTLLESFDVALDVCAAEDGHDGAIFGGCQWFELVLDLGGQLAGRRQDQYRWMPRCAHRAQLDRGDTKCQRLAGTRWCFAADVAAVDCGSNRCRLDREGCFDAPAHERGNNLLGYTEFSECRGGGFGCHTSTSMQYSTYRLRVQGADGEGPSASRLYSSVSVRDEPKGELPGFARLLEILGGAKSSSCIEIDLAQADLVRGDFDTFVVADELE